MKTKNVHIDNVDEKWFYNQYQWKEDLCSISEIQLV